VATQEWARACGARTLAITNDGASPLAAQADLALVTRAGEELDVPATKTFTTQLAALAVLGLALGGARLDALRGVPDALARALDVAPAAEALAERLTYVDTLAVSARGYAYAVARELALKLQEACYVTALGLSYADLEHGPIAIVDADTPALLVAAEHDRAMLTAMTALARRCAEEGAHVYGIGGDPEFAAACRVALPDAGLPAELAPLALAVPGQLLVEALARAKGIDPDAPRGLRKVTQTSA
jgi:glucosamine--fructose-6-phosphate aminotransferase (isomerizing)